MAIKKLGKIGIRRIELRIRKWGGIERYRSFYINSSNRNEQMFAFWVAQFEICVIMKENRCSVSGGVFENIYGNWLPSRGSCCTAKKGAAISKSVKDLSVRVSF